MHARPVPGAPRSYDRATDPSVAGAPPPLPEGTLMDHLDHPTRTALVLGGGGALGNAWLIGVVAGLTSPASASPTPAS